jgi:hypothetical protein
MATEVDTLVRKDELPPENIIPTKVDAFITERGAL